MTTARIRLSGYGDPAPPLVKTTTNRLASQYWQPRKQAKGLTSEALAEARYTFVACALGGGQPV